MDSLTYDADVPAIVLAMLKRLLLEDRERGGMGVSRGMTLMLWLCGTGTAVQKAAAAPGTLHLHHVKGRVICMRCSGKGRRVDVQLCQILDMSATGLQEGRKQSSIAWPSMLRERLLLSPHPHRGMHPDVHAAPKPPRHPSETEVTTAMAAVHLPT